MEYITVEILNSDSDRTGKFENISVERDILSGTDSKPVFKLENGDIVNCLDEDESEFELIKDGYSIRYVKI